MAKSESAFPEILPIKTAGKKSCPDGAKNSAPKNAAPAFTIRQTRLCAQLGLSEDQVRRRRDYFLHQGQHWDYAALPGSGKKQVLYSEIGAQVLLGTRDAVLPDLPGQGNKNAATTATEGKRGPVALLCEKNPGRIEFKGELVAWGMPGHNRNVVVCYVPGADPQNPLNLVTLRVRDNRNFLRGMRIPDDKPPGNRVKVTAVKDRDDVFELLGPIPRWRGRW